MNIDWAPWLAGAVLGLAGAGHCIGMCGGIVSAMSLASPSSLGSGRRLSLLLGYNVGRICSYTLIGTLVALGVTTLPQTPWPVARTLAAVMLMVIGLYFWGWRSGVLHVEHIGRVIWPYIQPFGRHLLPANTFPRALGLGLIWGWLPCGLIYSVLAFAAVQDSVWTSALTMGAFGLGTAPALLISGWSAAALQKWLQKRFVGRLLGSAYMIFALWTLGAAWSHVLLHPASDVADKLPGHHHHQQH